jgi:hypothetical protein
MKENPNLAQYQGYIDEFHHYVSLSDQSQIK